MSTETLTPYEAACEFLRAIRTGEYYGGDYDEWAHWALDGQIIVWHQGSGVLAETDEGPENDEYLWLNRDWLKTHGLTEADSEDACPLFAYGNVSVSRTRFLDALDSTTTNDAGEFCRIAGIDRRDPWVWRALNGAYLGFASKEYEPLREAVHSTDEGYAISLLQSGLPLNAIIELCALPPMPIEYALAMAGGAS